MTTGSDGSARLTSALINVTTLFFAWGFVTSTIDALVPSVRSIFSLGFAESMLTQFAYFLAYGLMSLPAAAIVARLGFARAIILSLAIMVAGCLFMPIATTLGRYSLVLAALFILATGVTILQVAANPLVAVLGAPDGAHRRLTLTQAFNSLGTVLGPLMASYILLRGGLFGGDAASEASRQESLRNIDLQFLLVAAAIAVLAAFLWRVRDRLTAPGEKEENVSVFEAFRSPWAVFGAVAIFVYVGAEVAIGSSMINFLEQESILGVSAERAARLLSLYWGGAMVGRFLGSELLKRVEAGRLLTLFAGVAALLCLTVTVSGGGLAAAAALAIGLFNSIMFPTIFTLTLERSTAHKSATSGLLCMAIVGGAIVPPVTGLVADRAGLSLAYAVPLLCYVVIALFARLGAPQPAPAAAAARSA
jgi:FHS family L-fucose permease-like MFS transporter